MNTIPFPKDAGCSCNTQNNSVPLLHIPAAQRANARNRFAPEGKQIQAMMPAEALAWVDKILSEVNAESVCITGPGDPLAVPGPTMETLKLLKGKFPQLSLGITTLGIGGFECADILAENGLSRITILVDAVNTDIVQALYSWIRPGKKTIPLTQAADILIDEQVKAVKAFKSSGFTIDIKTTVYAGINDGDVENIAREMASLGAESMTLVPNRPTDEKYTMTAPDATLMARLFEAASKHILVKIADQEADEEQAASQCCQSNKAKPSSDRPNVAVVSSNGMDVDLHLGQALQVLIYGPREDGLTCLLETRLAPEPGGGGSRWEKLADSLNDCFALLTASAGDNPRKILANRGISVIITEDNIEGMVDVLYGGGKKKNKKCRV